MLRVHQAYIAAYAPSREHLQMWTRSVEENIEMGVCEHRAAETSTGVIRKQYVMRV